MYCGLLTILSISSSYFLSFLHKLWFLLLWLDSIFDPCYTVSWMNVAWPILPWVLEWCELWLIESFGVGSSISNHSTFGRHFSITWSQTFWTAVCFKVCASRAIWPWWVEVSFVHVVFKRSRPSCLWSLKILTRPKHYTTYRAKTSMAELYLA